MSGARHPWILLCVAVLVLASFLPVLNYETAHAAQISNRTLTLVNGATDGGSKPGGVVNHQFSFTLPSSGNVGSIEFKYCTTAAGVCTMPTGLVTTSATLASQSGVTGFTMVNSTNGAPYLSRTAASITGPQAVIYQLNTITNPTTANYSFFVRISTFVTNNASGAATDTGSVTASTATQIVLTGTMPESLVFCVGQQVLTTVGVPDCTTATAGGIDFNQLFSPIDTSVAVSQMAASTNAGFGYTITINGGTLTSGSNTITAMGSATTSNKGQSQFGLNLRANTSTAAASFPGSGVYTSADVAPSANGTNYKGQPAPSSGYDTVDTFKFVDGNTVATSDNGGTPGASDSQIFTVSYIVNVPGSQPAGTYTTTLTYICTATF
jgi:hypothetical protein